MAGGALGRGRRERRERRGQAYLTADRLNHLSASHTHAAVHQAIAESVTTHRVNYSETDQMGVVYHARHVVWLDIARTEHLRQAGFSYRELETEGVRLVVTDLRLRYMAPARYDDVVEIRCRVKEARSRRVIFGYRLETGGTLIAEAETTLMCLDQNHRLSRLPDGVVAALQPPAGKDG